MNTHNTCTVRAIQVDKTLCLTVRSRIVRYDEPQEVVAFHLIVGPCRLPYGTKLAYDDRGDYFFRAPGGPGPKVFTKQHVTKMFVRPRMTKNAIIWQWTTCSTQRLVRNDRKCHYGKCSDCPDCYYYLQSGCQIHQRLGKPFTKWEVAMIKMGLDVACD